VFSFFIITRLHLSEEMFVFFYGTISIWAVSAWLCWCSLLKSNIIRALRIYISTSFFDYFDQLYSWAMKLIEKGCELNADNADKSNALMFAIRNHQTIIAEKLIENGCELNNQNYVNLTALMIAVKFIHLHPLSINFRTTSI
jgi:ankyrin repeat protein